MQQVSSLRKPIYFRRRIILFLLILTTVMVSTACLSLERRLFPGIWKLTSTSLPYEQDIRSKLKGLLPEEPKDEILIKLNPDGSFKQCNEGYNEGRWMSGTWEVSEGSKLFLAMNRQYFGPRFDVLLEGVVKADDRLKAHGTICKGKFFYPRTHPSFFDQPLASREPLGPFTLEQSIATQTVVDVVEDERADNEYQQSDFYNRSFIMTIEPVQPKGKDNDHESLDLPADLRAMPIQFYQNNTFQALAMNKILRGRFRITKEDKLAFDVSLFGAGRSMPGSVFSEGIGLSHEDKRSYLGNVQKSNGRLYVEGSVTFGSDLGSDARPEPVGIFLLTETRDDQSQFSTDGDDFSYGGVFE